MTLIDVLFALLSALLLDETLSRQALLGVLLIGLGITSLALSLFGFAIREPEAAPAAGLAAQPGR